MDFKKICGIIAQWFKKYYIIVLAALLVAVLVVGVFYVYGGNGEDGNGSTAEESMEEIRYYVLDLEDLSPYVEIGNYKGVEIEFDVLTDELIDTHRKKALDGVKEFVDTKLPAKKGDTILLDYEGYNKKTGEKFSGGTDTDVTMVLGEAGYIPGFEDKIVGHSAGEKFDIFVTFPDDYSTEELIGVEARFSINLKKVTEVVYPEITDEFAKKVGYESADAVNEAIRKSAEKQVLTQNMDKAWKAAVENCKLIKYPTELYNQSVNDFVVYWMDYYKGKAAEYGVELEELFEQTEEELKAEVTELGKKNADGYLKEELFMYAIAKDMGVDVISDEDFDKKVQEYANDNGVTVDNLRDSYTDEQLKTNILWDRVMNFVFENAVEKAPETSEESSAEETSEESSEASSEDSSEE